MMYNFRIRYCTIIYITLNNCWGAGFVVYGIVMNKGGVGKSSLCSNVAAVLSDQKKRVLIIDADGQGNSSLAFGLFPKNHKKTIYDVLIGECSMDDIIIKLAKNLFLAPSNDKMNSIDFFILSRQNTYPKPFHLLKPHVDLIKEQYDYIFIDSPPAFGLVTGNVLNASDKIIVPCEPDLFSVQGLSEANKAINQFKAEYNPSLKIAGVVAMKVEIRTHLHSEMLQGMRQFCASNDLVMYDTVIPKSIKYATSYAEHHKPAVWVHKNSPLIKPYFDLVKEAF